MGWITYDADMNSDPRAENQPTADSGHNVVLVGIDGSDQARHALERLTGAAVHLRDTRLEIHFADEAELEEIVEGLEAGGRI